LPSGSGQSARTVPELIGLPAAWKRITLLIRFGDKRLFRAACQVPAIGSTRPSASLSNRASFFAVLQLDFLGMANAEALSHRRHPNPWRTAARRVDIHARRPAFSGRKEFHLYGRNFHNLRRQ